MKPGADGSLHLPLPKDLRRRKVKVTATLEPAETQLDEAEAKMEAALAALGRLRELGAFREIPGPVALDGVNSLAKEQFCTMLDQSLSQNVCAPAHRMDRRIENPSVQWIGMR